ncbi:hypothetical protein D3C81_173800 [compost metagenome]
MEISELQANIEQLQYELNIENQRGGLKDATKVENLESQISELTAELEKPEIDPVIAKANEEVKLFGTTFEPFCKNALSYNVIRDKVFAKTYSLMDALTDSQAQVEKTVASTSAEIAELSKQIEDRDTIISALRKELFEAKELADDNANKRDAACRELLEASQTIDTLKDKLAATEVEKPKVRTNVEGADAAAEELKKTLPVIYDVEELDHRRSRFRAKFAETDESFEDYFIYKDAKYREVTAEEAPTFRAAYLAAQQPEISDEDHTHDISDEVTYTAPAFRDEDSTAESAEPGLVTETPTVVGSPVTREEHEELKARVAVLESIRAVA